MAIAGPTEQSAAAAPQRRRRMRWRWAAAAAVALVAAAVAVAMLVRTSAPQNGPVGNQDIFSASGSVQFGKPAATGAPTAFNSGDETAVLERIELVDPPPGIDVVQTHVAGRRRGAIPAMTAWPDRDFRDLHPVNGYRLAPADTQAGRDGVALVFVMNIKTPGRHAVPAVDVTYHIGDTRYRSRIRNAFAVCSYTGPKRVVHCRAPRGF
jgi:hypothetical protein